MKRISIILMVLLASTLVSAQRGGGSPRGEGHGNEKRMSPEKRQAQELDTLTKVLSLTDEQVIKIKELQENLNKSFEENRSSMDENSDREAMREQMKKLFEQYNKDLKGVLTDEQKEKYEAYLAKRKEEMKNNRPEGGGPGGPEGGQGGPPPF